MVAMSSARLADYILISCEHGGNHVPPHYRRLFGELQSSLQTHRGYDVGALLMAQELSASFDAPLVASTVTRLLVDLNRSIGHPRLHAEAVRKAPRTERDRIIAEHYRPHRAKVEDLIRRAIAHGQRVIHVASHSFTPELNGKVRTADVGLLYDPSRAGERRLCARWKAALAEALPYLRVRRNYPYSGKADGLIPYLRSRFQHSAYLGIEIEINQAIVVGAPRRWAELRSAMIESLRLALAPS
jgi:predicted N-formylglutamate amidohydrolase